MTRITTFSICTFLAIQATAQQPTRTGFPPPEENLRVFRCVLDERPRCLVFNLSPEVSLVWDTKQGILWRGWKPTDPKLPAALTGAVFDGKHGTQPTHDGELWFDAEGPQISQEDGEVELRYLGHRLVGEKRDPILRWVMRSGSGKELGTLSQTARIGSGSSELQLVITFKPADGADPSLTFRPPAQLSWLHDSKPVDEAASLPAGETIFTTTLSSK